MGNVIYSINFTIDGCCDHTQTTGGEEILNFFANLIGDAGLLAYGRITYQLMVPYWPNVAKENSSTKAEMGFARAFNSADKVVFSQSLDKVEDKNSRIVRTRPEDEILKLKKENGKNILLGGVAFPSYLIKLGLVDEYIFVVHPIIAGEGRRLLDGISLQEKLQLKLVDT
ncbi:MAG TPA: dihydrofolate reductase family protein, partial [Puia sp.]|nr:dihydrofolate reductase family protein [Puia sp.]